jgi:mycothione reductase
VVLVEKRDVKKTVSAKNRQDDSVIQLEADEILLAAGRRPNSDLLHPERSSIETDSQG